MSNSSSTNVTIPLQLFKAYTAIEVVIAIGAIIGNLLVIIVFMKFKYLRTITNHYVISLSVADLLVGLIGIPCAIATAVGLPRNFYGCLFMNSLLLLLCTSSIFSLVAVTMDRYWAIMYPMTYSAKASHKKTLFVIFFCWVLAAIIGLLPLFGWNKGRPPEPRCFFMEVIDQRYLAFIFFATILAPSVFMSCVYALIYKEIHKQIRRLSIVSNKDDTRTSLKSQSQAAQGVAVIVFMFMISWMPLYLLNTIMCFCSSCIAHIPVELINFCIVLSHLNSAWNPLLYAWGMRDWRRALKKLLGIKSKKPDINLGTTLLYHIGSTSRSCSYHIGNTNNIGRS